MARLVALIACEKVIIDTDNNVSVINLIQELKLGVREAGVTPKEGDLVPLQWTVLSVWYRDEDDMEPFEVEFVFLSPTKTPIFKSVPATVNFDGFTKRLMRVVSPINLFPAWLEGWSEVVLSAKTSGQDRFVEQARYPILLTHDAT